MTQSQNPINHLGSSAALSQSQTKNIGFYNADLLDGSNWIEGGEILLKDGKIKAIGKAGSLRGVYKDEGILWVDGSEFLITPGFANGHCHVSMGYLRGLGLSESDLISNLMFATENKLNSELTEKLAYSSIVDGLKSGITTFFDHYYFSDGIAKAFDQFGVKAWVGETIGDIGTAFPDRARWEDNKNLIEKRWNYSSRVKPFVAPHASDTVSLGLLKEMGEFAKANSLPVHLHLSQTKSEFDHAIQTYGKSPVAFVQDAGILSEQSLVVHMVYLGDGDIEILSETGASVGFCPSAQFIYEKLCPIERYYENQIPVVLGTDCAVTNDQMNMLSEMRCAFLAMLDRGIREAKVLPKAVVSMATSALGQVLNVENFGVLAPNASADLVFLEKEITVLPMNEPRENLILSFGRSQVKHVCVEGEFLVWNQKLTRVDEKQMKKEYLSAVEEIWNKQKGA